MALHLHWFLPTNGDSRTDVSYGNAVTVNGHSRGLRRDPTRAYLGQIARAAEQQGFESALVPTGSDCEDAWIVTSALIAATERLRFLVALRPGAISPTVAAEMAATFQRFSADRLLLNVVTGGEDTAQRRHGDWLSKTDRYARTGEFLHIFRRLFSGERVTYTGEHYRVEDAALPAPTPLPPIFFGGSSPAAVEVAAAHADVYLTWGEPPEAVEQKIDDVRLRAARHDRALAFGIRLHVITRDTSAEAWAAADKILAGISQERIDDAFARQSESQSEGQRRMTALHGGRTDHLEVSPNLWAGIGLVRGGAGTALVGSHDEVADRIAEYHALGLDHFVLSGYPHLEETYSVGEGLRPVLESRGLLAADVRRVPA